MRCALVYRVDSDDIRRVLDGPSLTIGRAPSNDIVIDAASVSDRHARLHRDDDGWRVMDLGSDRGIRINGHATDGRLLRPGDTIALGDFELRFVDAGEMGVELSSTPGTQEVQEIQAPADFAALCANPGELPRLHKILAILNRSSEAIVTTHSLEELYRKILDLLFDHLPAQRAMIMLWDRTRDEFRLACSRHREAPGTPSAEIRFSRTIAERVCREKVAMRTWDAQSDARFRGGGSVRLIGIRSAVAAPIWRGDGVEGLIYADTLNKFQAFDRFDLDLLSALGNHLAVAIDRNRLEDSIVEQKLIRARLERYHSPAVISHIVSRGAGSLDALLAEAREVTVLFSDLVGFTARCEQLEPEEVARLLNRYFARMTEIVFRHEGTLDKYIGDCVMAVFGAPLPDADHARRAVEAALDMREALHQLNRDGPSGAPLQFRIGIHSGPVVAGDIGSVSRRDYTVLGRTVNLAARLEALVATPGQIVVSDATRDLLGDAYQTRFIGSHQPKGISREVGCHEIVGRGSEPGPTDPAAATPGP